MPPIVRRATEPDRPAWDAFIASRPEADILQAWSWGECTALAGEPPVRILVEDGGSVRGVAQVLLRPAGFGRRVAYVAHGPVWERSAPDADRIFAWLLHGLNVNFYFGGTSLLIVVGVALQTMKQMESQLLMRHYEGFLK